MLSGFDMGEALIRRGLGRYVDTVVIGGDIVMEGRKFRTIDTDALYQEVREEAACGRTEAQLKNEAFMNRIRPYYQSWYNSWLKDLKLDPYYVMNSRI